jgi:death-on-curing protein
MAVRFLSLEDLLDLCSDLRVGPVRDLGLLGSAALRPQTTLMGSDAYPTAGAKAAALMHSIAANRALVDGNKRFGWHATAVFLALNGLDIVLTHDEAFDLTMAVASGDLRDVDQIAASLRIAPRH